MAGQERAIAVLKLFTLEMPAWTVEDLAAQIGVSVSSAYRYVAVLTEAGLLTTAASGRYVLGPAIIQLDRQIQLTDPLLRVAKPVMTELARFSPENSTVLLCRIFGDTVLCVHREVATGTGDQVSYERGRPMPLFRGATSKAILASFQARDLARLYKTQAEKVAAAGLGRTLDDFRAAMAKIRRTGYSVSHGEIDPGMIGVAAPIIGEAHRVVGSLSYVVREREERSVPRLATLVVGGAHEIEEALRAA